MIVFDVKGDIIPPCVSDLPIHESLPPPSIRNGLVNLDLDWIGQSTNLPTGLANVAHLGGNADNVRQILTQFVTANHAHSWW